ncbi:hypothetical protein AAFN86_01595 [Roseomonas sp. CAU 1739]|uniref:hypothetical protein n=1 Tax=Roseomonas sp. CAU 1739 TaxID=3140364 RepID=UPI00325BE804
MNRRAALPVLLALAGAAPPASALTPCRPGTRGATLAVLRFGLLLPNGDDVTDAQWRTFRSDILDPVLRAAIAQEDEAPITQPQPQRFRRVSVEVRVDWIPAAPPELPPRFLAVTRAWQARFPGAPVEAMMLPACL